MEELVNAIEEEGLPEAQQTEVYATLAKVLGNVVKNPAEPKYRTLKKDNRMVQEKIGRSSAAVSLLLALGFEDQGATYICPASTSLEHMEEVVQLLECVVASREETAAPSPAAPAPAAAAAPSQPAVQPSAPQPTAATAKSALNPQNFSRREDTEKMRSAQAGQLAAVRAAQQAQYSDGGSTPSPSAESDASAADAKKKPAKSAFDFESRAKQQEKAQKATDGLQDLRQLQREKFKDFKSDPNAQQQEAYQRPASVAAGGQAQQGWGDWLSGMFGGGSSSSGGGGNGGSGGRPERRGPNVKGIGDLPKPVRRG